MYFEIESSSNFCFPDMSFLRVSAEIAQITCFYMQFFKLRLRACYVSHTCMFLTPYAYTKNLPGVSLTVFALQTFPHFLLLCRLMSKFLFLPCFSFAVPLQNPISTDAVVNWQTNKIIEMVCFMCYQINIQKNDIYFVSLFTLLDLIFCQLQPMLNQIPELASFKI